MTPRTASLAAALCLLCPGAHALAGIFSDNVDMLVVAERKPDAGAPTATSCAVIDGGFIEAGDPIAGDTPPSADRVAQAVDGALASAGFTAAAADPAVVLTYHWGVLRIDHVQIRKPYGIKSNLMARIQLVSTEALGAEVENHIFLREKSGDTIDGAAAPPILIGPALTARQEAEQPRFFVIVSAYRYQDLLHRNARLLWRVKLSAREQSGDMKDVIPAMIMGGAAYFGKDLPDVKTIEVTPGQPSAATGAGARASLDALHLDKAFVGGLIQAEHDAFSGTVRGAD